MDSVAPRPTSPVWVGRSPSAVMPSFLHGSWVPQLGMQDLPDDPSIDGVAASHLVTFLGGGAKATCASSEIAGAPGGAGTAAVTFSKSWTTQPHTPRGSA